MTERNFSRNLGGSNASPSRLDSKMMVQSHLKSMMPSLKGGKANVTYIYIRVQESLKSKINYEEYLKKELYNRF